MINIIGGTVDKYKLHHYKKKLIKEKKKLMKSLNNMSNMEEFASMDVYYSDISGYDNHPADIGTEVFMIEQDNGFKNKLKDKLQEIDRAFENIKSGSYGICEICKKEIENDRLNLIPYSKSCMECAKDFTPMADTTKNNRFISIDEEQGSSFSDTDEDVVAFDREDTYQRVASFNIVSGDPSFSTGDNINVMDEEDEDCDYRIAEIENISQEYYDQTLT